MQSDTAEDDESGHDDDTEEKTHESITAWQPKSEEELKKWQKEKECYDEIIEYIKEVDEILNLIKPFPRDEERVAEKQELVRVNSQTQSPKYGLDHLENIIKLVEQLKELQENNSKFSERTYCIKDLKKLREHKRRLKNEELEFRDWTKTRNTASPENVKDLTECISKNRKISSTASEKFESEGEGWQHKRKSLCLTEGQKSKVSKWTKVKEAFHWEKTTAMGKPKKELYLDLPRVKNVGDDAWDPSPDEEPSAAADGFGLPLPPPPPVPPRTPTMLSVPDFPSSSSSDRLDEMFLETQTKGTKTSDEELGNLIASVDDGEDGEVTRRKSVGEEFPSNLSKEDLATRSAKSNKTTWGKVKDIIQTRKDSLKKKPKKRGSDEFKKRRKLSTLSTSQFSDQFEDLSSPEDKLKTPDAIPRTSYDFSEDPQSPTPDEKVAKKLTPALTITLPSTEELRCLSREDLEKQEFVEEDKSNILSQFSCQAQYCEDKTKFGKVKAGQNQKLSRWIKVKRVFLTSGTPSRPANYSPVNDSSPTSQNKSSGFFSDMESDEVSSGEWIDDKSPSQEKLRLDLELQEETRKSYHELQKKLSQEFDQKLREWEIKTEGSKLEESSSKREDGDCIPKGRKTRDSMAVPLPSINDLSPEFKKKLNDWKKMKTSQSSSSVSSSATKEDIQGQNIKIKIGEWQPWRSKCSQKVRCEQEDFSKKLEDGQKMRSRPPSSRRDSKKDSNKKQSHSRSPSGGENASGSNQGEKDGRLNRRTQKDFQWVEKELQKIEREKMRLEQEKEKYLEREARLEKMKKTIGTAGTTQEILVRTPAGYFRFKGISQKFTKKLYEWEKARGIAPEASTFALLEQSARTSSNGVAECEIGIQLQRSKSTGSIPELSSSLLIQTMAHHASSLSLNDVDEFKNRESDGIERMKTDNEEPEAIIVDVEDIVEETALLADTPLTKAEIPVYTFATQETDTINNSANRLIVTNENVQVVETTSRVHNVEITKESRDTDAIQRTEHEIPKIEKSERIDFQESYWAMKGVTSFKNSESRSEASGGVIQAVNMEQKNELHIEAVSTLESKSTEANSHHLRKSPKKFFEWSKNPEMSESKNMEDPQDWKPRNLSGMEKKSNEALKQRIKEKITLMQRMSMEGKQPAWKFAEEVKKAEESEKKVEAKDSVYKPQIQHLEEASNANVSIINVFVPTKRKIISPVKTTQGTTPAVCTYVIDDVKSEDNQDKLPQTVTTSKSLPLATNLGGDAPLNRLSLNPEPIPRKRDEPEKIHDIGMPPLPNSPKLYKKLNSKETAPSIRTIINKFNQKISEHESTNERRSESGSPRLWRSPVFGRRTQEKIDKYSKNGEVQKSASLDNMRSIPQVSAPCREETPIKGILKSSSVDVMKVRSQNTDPVGVQPTKENSPSIMRALKIQKAKEDFLSGRVAVWSECSSSTTPETSFEAPVTPQIEITNEDFQQSLTKSVSAETITNEKPPSAEANLEKDGRPLQKSSSKFDISSIKSKFRKIRMRKEKEPKLNTVAVLCRQSLLIEAPKPAESQPSSSLSKSCPSSPVMDRSKMDKTNKGNDKKK